MAGKKRKRREKLKEGTKEGRKGREEGRVTEKGASPDVLGGSLRLAQALSLTELPYTLSLLRWGTNHN